MTTRKKAAILILTLSIMIMTLVGCAAKTYANLEEWYNDNPKATSQVQAGLNQANTSDDMSVEFAIEDNQIIYRYKLNEQLFGLDDETDRILKSTLENNLNVQRDSFIQSIDDIALGSGIDASLISVHLEYYNPGDTTPVFSQVVTK
ncbi:MAG: DUF4854 domain-containing protein [Butyrivibrio sp.]|nr:DUF4854 domain-containing protein [Muribaculum sp.]MCM1552568.1 DUF4854 domain-containing protein [Butyrivibrio sp.]